MTSSELGCVQAWKSTNSSCLRQLKTLECQYLATSCQVYHLRVMMSKCEQPTCCELSGSICSWTFCHRRDTAQSPSWSRPPHPRRSPTPRLWTQHSSYAPLMKRQSRTRRQGRTLRHCPLGSLRNLLRPARRHLPPLWMSAAHQPTRPKSQVTIFSCNSGLDDMDWCCFKRVL